MTKHPLLNDYTKKLESSELLTESNENQFNSDRENDLNALNVSNPANLSPTKVDNLSEQSIQSDVVHCDDNDLNERNSKADEILNEASKHHESLNTLQDIDTIGQEIIVYKTKQHSVKRKYKKIDFEDSEDELQESHSFHDGDDLGEQNKIASLDSDSEGTTVSVFQDSEIKAGSNQHQDEVQNKKKNRKFVIDSDSEEDLPDKIKTVKEDAVNQEGQSLILSITNLCDSEDSEEESAIDDDPFIRQSILKSSKQKIQEKNPKVKKMTVKDALKQRQEIQSESQRMLRESSISLPYHKPKERSIKEFLKNRPRLSVLKGDHDMPASTAIKMTTEELQLATKKIKEREEELKKFYKSESESEEEVFKEETKTASEQSQDKEEPSCGQNTAACTTNETASTSSAEIACYEGTILEQQNVVNNISEAQETIDLNIDNVAETAVENSELIKCTTDCTDDKVNDANDCDRNLEITEEEVDKSVHIPLLDNKEVTPARSDCDEISSSDIIAMLDDEINTCKNVSTKDSTDKGSKIIIHSVVTIPQKSMYTLEESVEFDFNLDGIEDIPAQEEDEGKKCFNLNDDDNANPDSLVVPKTTKQDLIKQLVNFTPSLSGDPDHEIDLDDGVVKPSAVIQLIERFQKHVEPKNIRKNKIQLDIVNVSHGQVHNETVVVSPEKNEELVDATDKPALRIKKLKGELQERIAQHRAELWKQKQQAFDEITKINEEKSEAKSDYEENILDNDEEDELTDGSTTDDEEEIDDINAYENKKEPKSAFIDYEADESDDGCENDEVDADDESNTNEPFEEDSSDTKKFDSEQTPRPLKRIIKAFSDDSDEENSIIATSERRNNDEDDDDTKITPYQPRPDKTPHKELTQMKSDAIFHTPITQLSALRDLNSGSKYLRESPVSPFHFPQPSPAIDTTSVKQRLFVDSCDVIPEEVTTQDLLGLCSGNFSDTNTEEGTSALKNIEPSTQDLLNICSGSFTGLGIENSNSDKIESSNENCTAVETDSEKKGTDPQLKYLDEDRIISQLLDEEELENFKKKFESPLANTSNTSNTNENNYDSKVGGRLDFDSSDDESMGDDPKIKQKKHKRLNFSDDESEDEEEVTENDEEIDLHDDIENDTNKVFDYDSEENEIEVPKESYKSTEFFDKEAELTESEWDSADEDERGLDVMEREQGDNDVFDEDKIRNDLEKIHMRNVLDQDNREIKILQELLLEDGELHGTGRQRQFRWRNTDDNANDDRGPIDADDVYLDEDDTEEQWRRLRYQREMFLKSQNNAEDDSDSNLTDSNSQVLKIGQEVLRRSISNSSAQIDSEKSHSSVDVQITKKSSILTNTRGSFLARSDCFLNRLAGITKINNISTTVKTSNIVFQTSSNDDDSESNKRKADDGTPIAIKKIRLSSNISPSLKGIERKKKLF